jgi:2-polyprenyl-3-methyl-5-hydroxy-6-metoxy-1,4-benzoquinol methylase
MDKSGRKQTFFSDDDFYPLRQHIFQFSKEICNYIDNNQQAKILEVGASSKLYSETVFSELDTRIISDFCTEKKVDYQTLDINPDAQATYTGSVEDLSFLHDKSFDVIIMLSVLEHVENIFAVPQELYNITKPGSLVFINTPFLFKVHGPIPDCWRISEFGYNALFRKHFIIKSIDTYPPDELGKNSMPLSLNVILERL